MSKNKKVLWRSARDICLNYAPGLLILIFGMLALHSAVRTVDDHEIVLKRQNQKTQSMVSLENKYSRFEEAAFWYEKYPTDKSLTIVSEKFSNFRDEYYYLLHHQEGPVHNQVSPLYRHKYLNLEDEIIQIENSLQNAVQNAENIDFSKILLMKADVDALAESLFISDIDIDIRKDIKAYEKILYWSVLAIGLCGFVLVVMNSHKLRRLKILNTEKKEALRLLQERLEAMESTFDGIGIVDSNGNVAYTNKAFIAMHGTDNSSTYSFQGTPWISLYTGAAKETLQEKALKALEDNGYWRGEVELHSEQDSIRHVEMALKKLENGGFIGTERDITERKKSSQEKEEMQAQFFQAQKMEAVGRLAGGIAHDFNNILAAIKGYTEFLVDDLADGSEHHTFAINILKSAAQAGLLVDQMLAFSRRKDSILETLDLAAPVEESLSMLRVSLPKTIEIESDIVSGNVPVHGNSTQITQLIMNLCVNAKDAMDGNRGSIKLELDLVNGSALTEKGFLSRKISATDIPDKASPIRIEDEKEGKTKLFLGTIDSQKQYARLSVQDTGAGMDRVILEHAFEPFFTTKAVDKGTGLGLAMVHGVVVSHEGALLIDTIRGQGTRFDIFIPLSEEGRFSEQDHQGDIKTQESFRGRILLVEDEDPVSLMMMTMLERMGHEAAHCMDGVEALEILTEHRDSFDLVITDQNMPRMTGLEMVMEIQKQHPDLPFILLSGYASEKLERHISDLPSIKSVLKKPVSRQVLEQHIKRFC